MDNATVQEAPNVTPYEAMIRGRGKLEPHQQDLLYVGFWLGVADERPDRPESRDRAMRFAQRYAEDVGPEFASRIRSVLNDMGVVVES